MTHKELVALAGRWLNGTMGCALVATERRCFKSSESPDAIGWRADGRSILVEAKTSYADFKVDRRKPHRIRPEGEVERGMGLERWYLSVPETIPVAEVHHPWGLLYVKNGKVYRVREAVPQMGRRGEIAIAELPLIVALTRRTEWAARVGESAPPDGISVGGSDAS